MCVLVSRDHFPHSVNCPFSASVVTMSSPNSADFWRERCEKNVNLCGKDYYYDSLVFCQSHIDLVFDENRMEPARQEEGPGNAGLNQVCLRMSPWYSEPICGGNGSQPTALKRLNEDSTGVKKITIPNPKTCCERRRERLARRKDDMPPPLPRRIDSRRIREDPALTEFYLNTDNIHHATSEDAYAQAWFKYGQSFSRSQ